MKIRVFSERRSDGALYEIIDEHGVTNADVSGLIASDGVDTWDTDFMLRELAGDGRVGGGLYSLYTKEEWAAFEAFEASEASTDA